MAKQTRQSHLRISVVQTSSDTVLRITQTAKVIFLSVKHNDNESCTTIHLSDTVWIMFRELSNSSATVNR